MEELKRSLDYSVTPQYVIGEKESVDPAQPPKFKAKDRPNTTDSFHQLQQEVCRFVKHLGYVGKI
jgi:hypothetical protein